MSFPHLVTSTVRGIPCSVGFDAPKAHTINCDAVDSYEQQRLFFLKSTGLLDSTASEAFDRITRMASSVFNMPVCLITLVDEHRQWFKSCVGLDVRETPRDASFCAHALEQHAPLIVLDAHKDPRFVKNPLVTGYPGIRFYAGVPLALPTGHVLGSLCVIDTQPRQFSECDTKLLQDMAALVISQIDLHQLAGRVNEVTRLPNRVQMCSDLNAACRTYTGQQRTLMLVDVMSNDQLQSTVQAVGSVELEQSLWSIATLLLKAMPPNTRLYHVGEARFALLMQEANFQSVQDASIDILKRLGEPLSSAGVTVQLEVNAGLVQFNLTSGAIKEVLRRATAALCESRKKLVPLTWYHADTDARHQRSHALLRRASMALVEGEFRLVYQPTMNLHTGQFMGVEALARWRHPEHGDVSPSEFIELIEKTALIQDFTEWVLHKALEQLASWRKLGVELTMAVNVSSRNLEHPRFIQVLRNACAVHQIHPQNLHIECTENDAIAGTVAGATLDAVRVMGIGISLDDFGVGYSNLACLHSLPVQMIKLDKSLILPIASDKRALDLVRSLLHMGHMLGYRLLAEGVETSEVLDILKTEGCDAVQGYYLSRPLEACEVPAFLQTAGLAMSSGSETR